ncbi:MAG TPA: LuxR C-terminal-related transcriptional regulator [Chloroflexia bacterium]|jgi:DNA-binding CsgD family transcriptional regulator
MSTSSECIADGYGALNVGDWPGARTRFEAALGVEDSAEAHDGLGMSLWWLNEIEAAHKHRASAYVSFKKSGALRRAAGIAIWLAREQVFLHGNASAMKGWFARAERLLNGLDRCPEQGWLALMRASMLAAPLELERVALDAIETAREFNDADLEAMGLAFGGLARVALGRVDEGMACLDEAMAMATGGELAGFQAISETFCVTLSACELAGDLVRTEHWCHAAAEFARKHNCQFLSAYCRTTYGGLLTASGRWRDAEMELLKAIETFDLGHRALRVHAVLKLADLRVCQGRLEEAQALLAGYEDQGGAVLPLARLHMARGEAQLAKAVLVQAIGGGSAPELYHAPLLLLLVEALLALGDADGAHTTAQQLAELARKSQSDLLMAQADIAEGQVRRFLGEPRAAECFQSALDGLKHYERSLVVSRARLEMARLLRDSDWAGAVTWARAALASFERLGATHDADEAAKLLRELGVGGRTGPRLQGKLTRREAEVLALVASGLNNREIADRLFISAKTAEHHVSQVLSKLGARSRAEAAALALSEAQGNDA